MLTNTMQALLWLTWQVLKAVVRLTLPVISLDTPQATTRSVWSCKPDACSNASIITYIIAKAMRTNATYLRLVVASFVRPWKRRVVEVPESWHLQLRPREDMHALSPRQETPASYTVFFAPMLVPHDYTHVSLDSVDARLLHGMLTLAGSMRHPGKLAPTRVSAAQLHYAAQSEMTAGHCRRHWI